MNEGRAGGRMEVLACAVLALITFSLYWQVRGFEFVTFDDDLGVYTNPIVLEGLSLRSVIGAFTWFTFQWQPLTLLSFMLDGEIHGLEAGGFHFTNVILHTANACLLFLVLRAMTGAVWASLLVAMLFAIHPLHVESVAWVSGRKDVLSTFFWFATLGAYLHYVRVPGLRRMALVIGALFLGLLSKPMLVTAPFLLLVLDLWPLQRIHLADFGRENLQRQVNALVVEKVPMFALAVFFSGLALFSQGDSGTIGSSHVIPLMARLENVVVSYAAYLVDAVWPAGLSFWYPFAIGGYESWRVIGALLLLGALSLTAVLTARKQPYFLTGWLWFLGTLVPVIGFVQIGAQSRADRYTYVPLIGIFIVFSWGLKACAERWPRFRSAVIVLAVSAVAVLSVTTAHQVGYWKDSESLYLRALDVTPGNYLAHYNLALLRAGEKNIEEAKRHYFAALAILPTHAQSHNNLGAILAREGSIDAAVAHFRVTVQVQGNNVVGLCNLATALITLGQLEEAGEYAEHAAALAPDAPRVQRVLHELLEARRAEGKFDETPN